MASIPNTRDGIQPAKPSWAQLAKRLDKDGRWQPGDDDPTAYAKWAHEEAQPATIPKPPDHKTNASESRRPSDSSMDIRPELFCSAPNRQKTRLRHSKR